MAKDKSTKAKLRPKSSTGEEHGERAGRTNDYRPVPKLVLADRITKN